MRTWKFRRALPAAVVGLMAACQGGAGQSGDSLSTRASSPPTHLDFRLVVSDARQPCDVRSHEVVAAGVSCSWDGRVRYELGPVLARIIVRGARLVGTTEKPELIVVQIDAAGSAALDRATQRASGRHLATVLDGRVVQTPYVTPGQPPGQPLWLVAEAPELRDLARMLHADAAAAPGSQPTNLP